MEVLVLCPANVVTGGPESLHQIACEMNKMDGIHARMWYRDTGHGLAQAKEYEIYGVDYVLAMPNNYRGAIIFPEIWANEVINPKYDGCIKIINWAGVDVYYWNNDVRFQGLFLQSRDAIHSCHSVYAMNHLSKLGVEQERIFKVSDVLNTDFFKTYEEVPRNNVVLYNPVIVKLTDFQKAVMNKAREEGIVFKPIEKMTRAEVIDTMHQAKLYIDFGVFSGRERLPREAVMCGCCIITSNSGAAGCYEDMKIPDTYKFDISSNDVVSVVQRIKYVLQNYNACMSEFDTFRQSIKADHDSLHECCENLLNYCKEHLNEV